LLTIDTALQTKGVRPAEFERVIVDTSVQEKVIAHPIDSSKRNFKYK